MRLSRILVAGMTLAILPASLYSPLHAGPETTTKEPEKVKSAEVKAAEKAFGAGQFDEALKLLIDAEKKDASQPPARLTLARFFLMAASNAAESDRAKLYQLARTNIERSAVESPSHPDVYLQIANIAINEGRLTETILSCQTSLQLGRDPRWTADQRKVYERESHAGLSAAFERRGDWESAKYHLMSWKSLDPNSAPVMQTLAKVYFKLGNPDAAYKELQGAKKADPMLDQPEVTMGQLWAGKAAELSSAPANYEVPDSTAETSTDPNILDAKAAALKAAKAKAEAEKLVKVKAAEDEAAKMFKKAIELSGTEAKVFLPYGGWLLDLGNFTEAAVQIQQAKKLEEASPTKAVSPETKYLLGMLARYEGKLPVAEKIFEEIYREQPANFPASNQLALVLAEQPGFAAGLKKALDIATVNRDRLQRNAEAWATLGWVNFQAGKLDEAEKCLNVAISSGSLSPDTAYYIGMLLQKKDDKTAPEGIRKFLEPALDSRSAFIHRADAKGLIERVNLANPKKDETKKDEPKKDELKKEPKK